MVDPRVKIIPIFFLIFLGRHLCESQVPLPSQLLSKDLSSIDYSFTSNDFMVFTQQRSCSTLLVDLMNKKLKISAQDEPFNLGRKYSYIYQLKQLFPTVSDVIDQPAELAKALKLIYKYGYWSSSGDFLERDPSTLFGFKVMATHIGDQSLAELLTHFQLATGINKLKLIHLVRGNNILGALSNMEARKQLKWTYSKTDALSNTSVLNWSDESTLRKLVEGAMSRCLRHQFYEQDLKVAQQRGLIELLSIRSEDLIEEQDCTLDRISHFLTGHPLPPDQLEQSHIIRGRSSVDLHVRIPRLSEIAREMERLLPLVRPSLPRQLVNPGSLRICQVKVHIEILQLDKT